ncbi:UNVERIFIED_CONTAM: hypothetical protein H355_013443 [Colinus virginianus]|nr:hypothetical protein H355_013443 [Colinus virginianus]
MCGGTPKATNGTGGQIEKARNSSDVPLGNDFPCTKLDERIRKSLRGTSVSCVSRVTRLLQSCWSSSEFDLNEIRLIVYQDCERRGRQVLFDSKAVRKIDEAVIQYTRPASDVNMLGEMMFGSVAMSYKGSTLKIHYIRLQDSFEYINQDPSLGKLSSNQNGLGTCRSGSNLGVLQLCSSKLLQGVSEGGPLRLIRSASFFAAHSTPVDMPSRGQNEDRDSGIARSASLSSLLVTPFPSPSSSSSSSSSYQRRWLRSQTTSLENGIIPR